MGEQPTMIKNFEGASHQLEYEWCDTCMEPTRTNTHPVEGRICADCGEHK